MAARTHRTPQCTAGRPPVCCLFPPTEIPSLSPCSYSYRMKQILLLFILSFSTLVNFSQELVFLIFLYLQVQVYYPIHWCSYQHPQLSPTTKSLPQCCIVLYNMGGLSSTFGCAHGSPTHSYYTMNHSYTVVHVSLHIHSHYYAVNQSHAVQ